MIEPVFVDTNVLVYAIDTGAGQKRTQALGWMQHLWESRRGRLSIQVLNEYYAVATRKLKPGRPAAEARGDVRTLLAWRPLPIDQLMVEGAWSVEDRFGFSFWDALIVAAAQTADCRYLLSEDFQHGQQVERLEVVNPFQSRPPRPG